MGCEFEKCRKPFYLLVGLATLLCLVIIGYGGYLATTVPLSRGAYFAVVAIGVIGCLVSVLGICAAKKKNKWCLLGYGVCGSIAALVFLIVGVVLFLLGSQAKKLITTTCVNSAGTGIKVLDNNKAIAKGVDAVQDYVDQIDQSTGRMSATFMCSRYCPCSAAALTARKDCKA
jgi:hypothetical protein